MKIHNLLSVIALTAVTAACNTETTDIPAEERVVLEVEYINYAWTPQYFGFFVDASGRAYRYDRNGAPYTKQEATSWSPEELADKFKPAKSLVVTRPASEVTALLPTIDAAASGGLSTPNVACADAGALTYRAYRYNPATGRYTAVPLRVEGDFAQQNTSQAAQQLIAYIRSLQLLEELLGCDP